MDDQDSIVARLVGRPIVGKYLIVAEAYDAEGESSLIVRSSPGVSIWDERGLLASAMTRAELVDMCGWENSYHEDD